MTVIPNNADDMQYLDGLQSLTLKVTGQADVHITQAIDEPITFKEAEASRGQVQQGDKVFVWPAAQSAQPPLGAVLVDADGVYWTILEILYKDQVNVWEATCRNLSIVANLDNTATVLRATYAKGSAGVPVPTWHAILSGIPARFQPSVEAAQIFLGAEFTKTTYRVIFAYPIPIELAGGEYRLVDANGSRYRVMEYLDEERIDALPVAIAVKILEGSEYWGSSGSGS